MANRTARRTAKKAPPKVELPEGASGIEMLEAVAKVMVEAKDEPATDLAKLTQMVGALVIAVECLCNNLSANSVAMRQDIGALSEQVQLTRHRLESLDRRLDRAELVLADVFGYPTTQTMLPHIERLRDQIENGRPHL